MCKYYYKNSLTSQIPQKYVKDTKPKVPRPHFETHFTEG